MRRWGTRLALVLALAAVLVPAAVVPAMASTTVRGPLTLVKVQPYRVKLANGTYTTDRATVRKSGRTSYYFFTKKTAFRLYYNDSTTDKASSRSDFYFWWKADLVGMEKHHDRLVSSALRRSGSSTKLNVLSSFFYDAWGAE